MRIAVDANPLAVRKTTGVQNHARGVVRALVDLAGDDEWFLLHEESLPQTEGFDRSFLDTLPANWQVRTASVPGPTAGLARWFWEHRGLPRLVRQCEADVFYSASTLGPYTRRCPVAITIHDLAQEAYGLRSKPPRAVARLARRAERVFTVSDVTADDVHRILRIPRDRLVTVYNAPAPGIAHADRARQREVCEKYDLRPGRFLLCVGDENWRREYQPLWDALETLWGAGRLEYVQAAFVGRADWRKTRLYARVRQGPWRDGAVFLSNVRDADLAALYSAARITVVPTRAEGFGMPVIEAMACGCPVICSDIPVLREIADDAAHYIDLDTPGALSAAIPRLIEDDARREDLIARGRKQADRFSWDAAARIVYQTLTDLAGG